MSKFKEALEVTLHHEGGYVNHPKDPGGETNLGVTKRVYEEWGGTKDMKELTPEDVEPIYQKNYWDKLKCDELPEALALCVFDFGVNAGPGRAAKYLQSLVGALPIDGGIGPMTLAAVDKYIDKFSVELAVERYQEARQKYYEELSTFATFGRGWTRRVEEVTEKANSWL